MLFEFPDFYSNMNFLIQIVLVIVIPLIISQIVITSIQKFEKYKSISKSSLDLVSKIIRYLTIFLILMGILNIFGLDLHSFVVSIGLLSLAVTLAAKDTLSNVISGIIIITERRFVIGDIVEIDGHKGQVKKIGFKSVELYYKKRHMVVPNVLFTTKPFINHTKDGYYAIIFDIKILNKYNLDEKISQIEKILSESELILDEPKYSVRVHNITTTGVEVSVKAYISNPLDDTMIITELIKKIKREVVLEDMD